MINSPFNPMTDSWAIAWPGRVARHALIYRAPPSGPMQEIPLGNGDLGVPAWCEDTRLVMAVNKCDRGDDAAFGRFRFPAGPFRHMGMESMSVLACAMNEALFQGHDGVIRVAPAAGRRTARFTLQAAAGFAAIMLTGNFQENGK